MKDLVDGVELANWRQEFSYWTKQIHNCVTFLTDVVEMLTSTIFVPKYVAYLSFELELIFREDRSSGSRRGNETYINLGIVLLRSPTPRGEQFIPLRMREQSTVEEQTVHQKLHNRERAKGRERNRKEQMSLAREAAIENPWKPVRETPRRRNSITRDQKAREGYHSFTQSLGRLFCMFYWPGLFLIKI